MDGVKTFNNELSALYEGKPPISRAKMATLTKLAIKAIKYYKHIVQSVEKFIHKCRTEYKVPGLYVIDSIVRQSRHQFGADKDVFAPRFSKNIVLTFFHLLKCLPDEKPKIIRVLNLWQKNGVFLPAVIQPLLDLATDPENPEVFKKAQDDIQACTGLEPSIKQPPHSHNSSTSKPQASSLSSHKSQQKPSHHRKHHHQQQHHHQASSTQAPAVAREEVVDDSVAENSSSATGGGDDGGDLLRAVSQLLQSTQEPQQLSLSAQEQQLQQLQLLQQQLVQQTQLLSQPPEQQTAEPLVDSSLLSQIQKLTSQLLANDKEESDGEISEPTPSKRRSEPTFNKKILDFDYGESDEENSQRPSPVTSHRQRGTPKENSGGKQNDDQHHNKHHHHHHGGADMDSHRHRIMREEYEDVHGPREPQKPPEPEGCYPDDSFDGQASMDTSQDQDLSHDREEYEEGEYVDDDGDFPTELPEKHHRHQPEEPPEPPMSSTSSKKSKNRESRHKREERSDKAEKATRHHRELPFSVSQDFVSETRISRDRSRERSRDRERSSRKHRRKNKDKDKDRSRSRSRTPKRKKRSRSREKKKRSRSRSKDRKRKHQAPVEPEEDFDEPEIIAIEGDTKEKRRKEKAERERKDRGYPPLRENFVAICSTTLWIGHLNKSTTYSILESELKRHGEVSSINLIPPRGCAFVCMANRKDAHRVVVKLRGAKLLGSTLKTDWAPGKGLKETEWQRPFDKDLGVVYLPYHRLSKINLDSLLEGSVVDEESLPSHMRNTIVIDEDQQEQQYDRGGHRDQPAAAAIVPAHPPPQPVAPPVTSSSSNDYYQQHHQAPASGAADYHQAPAPGAADYHQPTPPPATSYAQPAMVAPPVPATCVVSQPTMVAAPVSMEAMSMIQQHNMLVAAGQQLAMGMVPPPTLLNAVPAPPVPPSSVAAAVAFHHLPTTAPPPGFIAPPTMIPPPVSIPLPGTAVPPPITIPNLAVSTAATAATRYGIPVTSGGKAISAWADQKGADRLRTESESSQVFFALFDHCVPET